MSQKPEVKTPPPVKRIKVILQLEGAMMDKDTPVSEDAVRAYFELHFQCPKGLKAHVLSTQDVTA